MSQHNSSKAFAPNAWTGDNLIGWCPKQALYTQITGCKNIHESHASENPKEKLRGDNAREEYMAHLHRAVNKRVELEAKAIRDKVIDSRYKLVKRDRPVNTDDIISNNYHRGMRN